MKIHATDFCIHAVAASVVLAFALVSVAPAAIGQSPNRSPAEQPALKATAAFNAAAANGRIAFMSTRIQGIFKIFTMNPDGSGVICLMCDGATDPSGTGSLDSRDGTRPAVSPDGSSIAFVRQGGIWLMNFNGTNQRSIGATGTDPAWSPDGTKIAFTHDIGNSEVFVMNADGSNQINITNNPGNDQKPSWGAATPDYPQGRIAFTSFRTGFGRFAVYVIAPTSLGATFQGSPAVRASSDVLGEGNARWSPDGRKLVFTRVTSIYTLDLDSLTTTRLTTDGFINDDPTWSPDATRIAYERGTSSTNFNTWEIFVIDAVSGAALPGNITNNSVFDGFPSWAAIPTVTTDLAITMSPRDSTAARGTILEYTVQVTNNGPANATGVVVTDTLPAGFALTPFGSPQCTSTGQAVSCAMGNLAVGASVNLHIDADVTSQASLGQTGNTASVQANETVSIKSSTAMITVVAPLFTVSYDGKLRDKVGRSDSAIVADGDLDATFTVQFQTGNGSRTITALDLQGANGNEWDTFAGNGTWVLGATYSIDGVLLNQLDGTINTLLGNQGHLRLFASDTVSPPSFVPGKIFTLIIRFADNTSFSQRFTIPPTPALTLVFDGKLRDRVGQRETVTVNPDPDGNPDGSFTVLLP